MRTGASTRSAVIDGNNVELSYRPVIVDPLTTEDEGGISLEKNRAQGADLLRRG